MRLFTSLGSLGTAALLSTCVFVACGSNGGNSGGDFAGDDSSGSGSGSGSGGSSGSKSSSGGSSGSGSGGGSGSGSGSGASSSGSGGGSGSGSSGSSSGASGSGSSSGASSSGASGSGSSSGASSSGSSSGVVDAGVTRSCDPASVDVLADFEEGKGVMVNQGTPPRSGQFYVYHDASQTNQTPVAASPIAVAPAPSDDSPVAPATCNDFAMHSTASSYTQYVGLGGFFVSTQATYDLSAYDGVEFKIKTGSATQPVYFEMLTTDSEPATNWPGGTAASANVDQYNHRGQLLSNITTSWQTVHVPFSLLIPHWQPAPGSTGCPSPSFCQAPAYNASHAVGLTYSVYVPDFATTGSYDLWVDDITLYKDTAGTYLTPSAPPNGVVPAFKDGALGSCTKPTNAAGKDLQFAYKNWYSRFVTTSGSGLRVQRPENGNDTVSEGTAYGMLIAVYMNDPVLFAGLWTYWQQPQNETAGNLETWNNTGGSGSATDADQDAAFALLEAGKRFSNSAYTTAGTTMVQNIWAHDIDPTSHLPRGGSNYTGTTGTNVLDNTNPSYFAPAYYPTFQAVDAGHAWTGTNSVTSAVYTALNALANGTTGLVPAWCMNNCTQVGSNGAATDGVYQYDAHRVPWRVGLDACWNGSSSAKTFLTKISAFFAGIANSSGANGGGLGRLVDIYQLGGSTDSSAPNSMSLIGSAAVGAMSGSNAAFVNSAWQMLLDGENRATLDVAQSGSQSGYSYYNATVGLLTLLSLSGNFYPM
jgi:endo-1,4-beta-D-glucanase Y